MKHSLLLLFLAFFLNIGYSQNSKVNYDQDSKWFISLGGGAAWHTTDIKTKVKFGFTFELGYTFLMKENSLISLDLGLRYLVGSYEGNNYERNDGIQFNSALNGVNNPNVDYFSNLGYSVLNFRTSVHDLSLELQLNTNRLRERTGWNLFLFGSVGFSFYKTLGNLTQFDIPSQQQIIYNYDTLSSSGGINKAGVDNLLDDDFESALEGSSLNKFNAQFTPSIGAGFSYQVAPRIAIGLEHRTTFTLTDLFDGNQFNNDNTFSSNKDIYHYSGFFIRFHIRGGKGKTPPDETNSVDHIDNYSTIKPKVDIFDPAENPYTTDYQYFTIKAVILNVDSKSNVTFKHNGVVNNNFTFDPSTNRFESNVSLTPGQNLFEIRGTNTAGSDSENRIIILESDATVKNPPIVNFNNPSYSPFETSTEIFYLSASILNVDNQNDVSVKMNGNNLTNFNFNTTTNILTIPLTLTIGSNNIEITGTNTVGSDTKSTVIVYQELKQAQPPIVNFLNPGLNPFTTELAQLSVSASVLNVDGKNDITINVNGQNTSSFTYNSATNIVDLSVSLNTGSNVVEITGTNSVGVDSKSTVIIKKNPQVDLPPIVTFIAPNSNPITVYNSAYNVVARVENIQNSSQIQLRINGVSTTNFTFVASSKIMTINSTLSTGANIFEITASNNAGSDSKNTTIILEQQNQQIPPIVNFTNPSSSPYTVYNNSYSISGTVLNVVNSSSISVLVNGNQFTNFNYNINSKIITFPTNLVIGNNVIQITATNTVGSDTKSTILDYKGIQGYPPVVTITNPMSNPITSSISSYLVRASITNVDFKNQIQVKRNGMVINPYLYSFNPGIHQLVFNANLSQGTNIIEILGSNQYGSDVKTTNIVYNPIVTPCDKPLITFQSPQSGATSNTQNYTVQAQLLHVANSQSITLRVNGQIISGVNFNTATKTLTKSITLNPGSNVIQIAAVNSCGGNSKSAFVTYTLPNDPCYPPTISSVFPLNSNYTSSSKYITLKANVGQIANSQNITLKLNGQNVNFSFDNATKILSANLTLSTGNNQIIATAQNQCGDASFSWNIYHSTCQTPSITMINPTNTVTNVNTQNYTITATISEVQNSNNLQLKRNGQNINFIYNSVTNSFTSSISLSSGTNNIELVAQNQCGNDTKNFQVNFTPITTIDPPEVDITVPNNSPHNTNNSGITIKAILDNVVSQSQITVLFNGSPVSNYNYNPNSGILSMYKTLNPGTNNVKITAVNTAGSDMDQKTIIYTPPVTINPPQVVFTAPSSTGVKKVAGKNYTVTGYVQNVTQTSQVVFKVNGQVITNYTRNFSNGKMTFSLFLSLSNANSIYNVNVRGTNQAGTHSDYRVVQYDLGTSPMGGSTGGSGIKTGGTKGGGSINTGSKSSGSDKSSGVKPKTTTTPKTTPPVTTPPKTTTPKTKPPTNSGIQIKN